MDSTAILANDPVLCQLVKNWIEVSQHIRQTETVFNNVKNDIDQAFHLLSTLWNQIRWVSTTHVPFQHLPTANNGGTQTSIRHPPPVQFQPPFHHVHQVHHAHPFHQQPPVPLLMHPNAYMAVSNAVTPMVPKPKPAPTRKNRKRPAKTPLEPAVVKIERIELA
uniref:Uncharacterized protein n=1 Tax=Panagrolaimus sp. JU765 TaxID=591449 RepID=A0AC34QKQ1_9BILA